MACSGSSVVLAALFDVLEDASFTNCSKEASDALEAAKLVKNWCEIKENQSVLSVFSSDLVRDLQGTFSAPSGRLPLNREKMWRAVFSLCSSTSFVERWVAFLQRAGAVPTPILYQHLTDVVLRLLIRRHYEVPTTQEPTTAPASLSSNEGHALRYAAGYIVRSVSKKIQKSSVIFN